MWPGFSEVRVFLQIPSISELAKNERVMSIARTVVAYYYFAVPILSLLYVGNGFASRENFEPIWPLFWAGALDLELSEVSLFLKLFFVVTAILGLFFYQHRWIRILVFIGLWQVHAAESSFMAVNHQWYLWVYTSFIFVFLPNIWDEAKVSLERNRAFLLLIWFAQAIVMATYTLVGMWKLYFAQVQFLAGEVGALHPLAFAYHVSNWLPRLQAEAILAQYVIEYPYIVWPFFAGIIFIQVTAIWVMIRPSLQKVWGGIFILFHIGVLMTMGISFTPFPILLLVLFLNSPFAPEKLTFKQVVRDLPILGQILERVSPNYFKTS